MYCWRWLYLDTWFLGISLLRFYGKICSSCICYFCSCFLMGRSSAEPFRTLRRGGSGKRPWVLVCSALQIVPVWARWEAEVEQVENNFTLEKMVKTWPLREDRTSKVKAPTEVTTYVKEIIVFMPKRCTALLREHTTVKYMPFQWRRNRRRRRRRKERKRRKKINKIVWLHSSSYGCLNVFVFKQFFLGTEGSRHNSYWSYRFNTL